MAISLYTVPRYNAGRWRSRAQSKVLGCRGTSKMCCALQQGFSVLLFPWGSEQELCPDA